MRTERIVSPLVIFCPHDGTDAGLPQSGIAVVAVTDGRPPRRHPSEFVQVTSAHIVALSPKSAHSPDEATQMRVLAFRPDPNGEMKMFRKILTVAVLACGVGGMAATAEAMPVGSATSGAPEITLVAQGCGPGYMRGPYGGCRPMARGRVFAPRVFAPPRMFAPNCFVRRDRFGRPVRVCR
jgi:hypothetical protein